MKYPNKCKMMRKLGYAGILWLTVVSACGFNKTVSRPQDAARPTVSIYSFKMPDIKGDTVDFARFRGKKLLLVNTASECGFTPQYADLQKLHELHGDRVTILGFPANDFGGQEPGSNEEIAGFCQENYGVDFLMFSKISVKGEQMAPLYKWLTDKSLNGWNDQAPNWNFCKYLVNEEGELVKFYASGINPMGDEMLHDILQ